MNSRQVLEERAKRIIQYYMRHDGDKKRTCDHFTDEGICKRTIVNIIKRYEGELANSNSTDDNINGDTGDDCNTSIKSLNLTGKKPLGRKPTVTTPEMFDKIAKLFQENPDLSCREAAKRLQLSRTSIFRVIRKMKENNIEINKVIVSEPRCPTCHQRIKDPAKLQKSKK